jgi:hypothetical protein
MFTSENSTTIYLLLCYMPHNTFPSKVFQRAINLNIKQWKFNIQLLGLGPWELNNTLELLNGSHCTTSLKHEGRAESSLNSSLSSELKDTCKENKYPLHRCQSKRIL